MSANSKIEWTHHTFNPWWGCQRVSPGCEHCYAEALSKRFGRAQWGPGVPRVPTSEKMWKEPLRWNVAAREAGERRRVFCASMADVFEDLPELVPLRARLFDLVAKTPDLDWLLLTKRPENADRLWSQAQYDAFNGADSLGPTWAPNVWMGTTVEDQRRAEERIPRLLSVPAAVRFLSCEPLLGPVDFDKLAPLAKPRAGRIDWVICGGESGGGARPMHIDWVRSLRDQCADDGVLFFFKQWGAYKILYEGQDVAIGRGDRWLNLAGGHGYHGERVIAVRRTQKKDADRSLDGHTHDAIPEAR